MNSYRSHPAIAYAYGSIIHGSKVDQMTWCVPSVYWKHFVQHICVRTLAIRSDYHCDVQ